MGAGGQKTTNDEYEPQQLKGSILRRVPGEKPPFSVGQLKQAIPPHCFQRSVLRSFSYLTYDLIIVSALLYLALYQIPKLPSPYHYIAWPLYWIFQGCFATGVWVVGHECGHHAFSDYQLLDDIVGLILHSSMLVPYFSWKHSHRRHHANTGSMDTDEVYIPRTKQTLPWFDKYFKNPLSRFIVFIVILVVGWPLYIAFNVSGRRYPRFASHFDPYSPIYSEQERAQIIVSDAAIIAVSYMLYRQAVASSFGWVFAVYGVPVLIVNGFVVLITYLHHTHIALPHFDSSEWTWLRGALATMDRDYGILNKVFHNVTDTHILHHLFSMIPHYHAMEATEAIKPVLGEYYRIDRTPLFKAMWRDNTQCVYVEPEGGKSKGVYWYNNKL